MSLAQGLSIRQRLAVGFVLLGMILAGLLGVVLYLHSHGRAAEERFLDEAEPGRARAELLERSVLHVGLSLRTYLLHGDVQHLTEVRASSAQARSAVEALTPRDAEEIRELRRRVVRYLAEVEGALERRMQSALPLEEEVRLADLRGDLVEEVHELFEREEERTRAALARLATARTEVRQGVIVACALSLLAFGLIARWVSRTTSNATAELVSVAGSLAEGDWKPALRWAVVPDRTNHSAPAPRNEMHQIARAMGTAAWHLEQREARLVAEGEVARVAASSLDAAALGAGCLDAVVEHLGVEVGAIYLLGGEENELMPSATHALELTPLRVGEGLPGQAAKQRQTLVFRDIPEDSPFRVKLGYDDAPPRSAAAVPIEVHERLYGVLMVASLRELDRDAIAFLERSAAQLAVGLANAAAHETAQKLLGELSERNLLIQAQNEELQAQNEEIQAQSEELQAQGEELLAQTEQLQLQREEIQAQNEELMQRAKELEHHAAQLREANERKTDFLGVLAHELRNPLAPIVNGLFLLRKSGTSSEQGEHALEVIERQTQHLTRLIDDLLDVTRIARGKVRLERAPLDFAELVKSCVEDQRVAIDQKELQFELQLPTEPVMVDGDRTRLCQVVGNLLSNAIKFTDTGGRISVEVDRGGDEVLLRVVDTGVGIDPALLGRLFTPFSQGSNGLARTNGGLGLGLALVKTLLSLHEGTVEARSEGVGHGAEFLVRLPRFDEALPTEDARLQAAVADAKRILIIEDSQDAADTLREALVLEGHEVTVARTGEEGVRRAFEFAPEVVLCDLGLPLLDGYEVARRLRSDERFGDTFLVAVSGYASATDKQRAADAGFDCHQAKPLRIERILELIAGRVQASDAPSNRR